MSVEKQYISLRTGERAYPAKCTYGIELTRRISQTELTDQSQAWRMTIEVTAYNNVEPNIFLYQRRNPEPPSTEDEDYFMGVCSPVDLDEYPVDNPRDTDPNKFFRMSDVDLITRNRELLELTWDALIEDVTELIQTLVDMCELGEGEALVIGSLSSSSSAAARAWAETRVREAEGEAPELPVDDYTGILVESSEDPALRAGETAEAEVGVVRTWLFGNGFRLVTNRENNSFELSKDGRVLASGGVSFGYRILTTYNRERSTFTVGFRGIR